jgi:type II secretory pathway component PulK
MSRARIRACHGRGGFVLIMVMVVLTGLSLLALHLAARCRMRLAELTGTIRAAQGRWLAYAAVQRGLAVLAEDSSDADSSNAAWAQLGSTPPASWFTREIDGLPKDLVLSCAVQDEHAKFNIRSPAAAMQAARLGDWGKWVGPLVADWVDSDDARGSDGAESADYLESPEYGYDAKNRPLELLEELCLLKGMSPHVFLGEDTNGNYTLDPREDDGLAQSPPDNQDGRLDFGPWSLLTCTGDGKINVNTAPPEVLAMLPLFDRQRAAAVVAFRDRAQSPLWQQLPFRSVEDLRQAVPLEDWELDVLRSAVCTSSRDFRVVATVRDGRGPTVARHEVLLVRDQDSFRIRMYCGW